MPIYRYACAKCDRGFEARLERTSDPAPACPSCGATKAKKQLTTFAVASATPSFNPSQVPPCQGGTATGCGAGACGFN